MAEYAFTTLAGLRQAVREYLDREDLTETQLDTFIKTSARNIMRRLRVRQNERTQTSTGSAFTAIPLPEGYIVARSLTLDGEPLTRVSDLEIQRLTKDGTTGRPCRFARVGNELVLWPACDSSSYSLVLTYYSDLSDIASPDAVLLTLCPDLWLYGALLEASMFLRKQSGVQVWASMFENAMQEVNGVSDEEEFSGSVVAVQGGL